MFFSRGSPGHLQNVPRPTGAFPGTHATTTTDLCGPTWRPGGPQGPPKTLQISSIFVISKKKNRGGFARSASGLDIYSKSWISTPALRRQLRIRQDQSLYPSYAFYRPAARPPARPSARPPVAPPASRLPPSVLDGQDWPC